MTLFENGAPDRIRTHDPQIRSRKKIVENVGKSSKPAENPTHVNQWVRKAVANQNRNPKPKKKTLGTAATATRGKDILKVSLAFGYGIAPSSASPRRRKWTVDAHLCVEVLE